MKRFIKCLLWFLPFVLLFVGFNVLVDPANLLRSAQLTSEILTLNAAGQNALVTADNYNDRLLIKKYILETEQIAETVVLGSSRGIQIGGEMLGAETRNLCVTGATLEDVCAAWEMMLQNDSLPKTVIINIDVWFFDTTYAENRTEIYSEFYNDFLSRMELSNSTIQKDIFKQPMQLVSPQYFQTGLETLLEGRGGGNTVTVTALSSDTNHVIIRADGSYSYPLQYENAPLQTVLEERVSPPQVEVILASFANYNQIDPSRGELFEALLGSMQQNGVAPVLLLSPYHPLVYRETLAAPQSYPALVACENYVKETAQNNGILLAGSFDPALCGFDETDFMDTLHIKRGATTQLVQTIREWLAD